MNKRTFIGLCSAAMTTRFLSPLLSWASGEKPKNWAGNIEYSTEQLYSAKSLEQAREFVRNTSRLKVLGTRHCFNQIADSRYQFLSLKDMDKVVAIDQAARTVTVGAGMTYGQLCPYLDSKGLALHNLASLPHISVVGACNTATHGSGDLNGNLATAVEALEMITASGDVLRLRIHSFLGTLTRDFACKSILVVCHSVIVLVFRRLLERLTESELLTIDSDPDREVRNCSVTWYAFDTTVGTTGKMVLKEFNGIRYEPEHRV